MIYHFIIAQRGPNRTEALDLQGGDLAARRFADSLVGCFRVETPQGRVVWRDATQPIPNRTEARAALGSRL